MTLKPKGKAKLEPYQEAYLYYDGQPLPRPQNRHEMKLRMPFNKLCDGQQPVNLDPRKATHPQELWQTHGAEVLRWWKRNRQGRPLGWWMWAAPGHADQSMGAVTYRKAVRLAQKRCRWSPERQNELISETLT